MSRDPMWDTNMRVNMPVRDIAREDELEAMAEPDENGVLCILVVECE